MSIEDLRVLSSIITRQSLSYKPHLIFADFEEMTLSVNLLTLLLSPKTYPTEVWFGKLFLFLEAKNKKATGSKFEIISQIFNPKPSMRCF